MSKPDEYEIIKRTHGFFNVITFTDDELGYLTTFEKDTVAYLIDCMWHAKTIKEAEAQHNMMVEWDQLLVQGGRSNLTQFAQVVTEYFRPNSEYIFKAVAYRHAELQKEFQLERLMILDKKK